MRKRKTPHAKSPVRTDGALCSSVRCDEGRQQPPPHWQGPPDWQPQLQPEPQLHPASSGSCGRSPAVGVCGDAGFGESAMSAMHCLLGVT